MRLDVTWVPHYNREAFITTCHLTVMESQHLKQAVSILESAQSRAMLYSLSNRGVSSVPAPSRPVTNFSISRILGLENSEIRQDTPSTVFNEHRRISIQAPSTEHSRSDNSSRSSPNYSSNSDCDSEHDQLPTPSERVAKKKRQRTTFSLFEVWELERVFKRQPYLMPEDEKELIQSLGITARSLRYWFQNRRAKSRREGRKVLSECQRNSLDQFGRLPKKTSVQPPSNPWIQAEKMSYTEVNKHSAKLNTRSGPILVNHRHLSIKSDQPRCRSPSLVPMLRPYQLKRRLLAPTRPLYSRDFHRYQPY